MKGSKKLHGRRMDLITYAVSNRLQENGELLTYMDKDSIPKNVVEKSFEKLMNNHSDEHATQLVEDYKSYLRENVGVAITPKDDGLHVKGEINDDVVEIIELVHGETPESIVEGLVKDTINVLNPEQQVTIKNITLRDKIVRLKQTVDHTTSIIEHIEGVGRVSFEEPTKTTVVELEHIPEPPKVEHTEEITEPKEEIKVEAHDITDDIDLDVFDTHHESAQEEKVDNEPKEVTSEPLKEDTKGQLKNIWAKFMEDLDNSQILESLNIDKNELTASL